eukprot:g5020.t1
MSAGCEKGVELYEGLLRGGLDAVRQRRSELVARRRGAASSSAAKPVVGAKRKLDEKAQAVDKWATDSDEERTDDEAGKDDRSHREISSAPPQKTRHKDNGGADVRFSDALSSHSSKGCRSIDCYERIRALGEGQYGTVWQGRECNSGTLVALKQIKLTPELCGSEGFPRTALREINVLLNLRHDNIVRVHEIVVGGSNDSRDGAQIFMVMDYIPVELGHMLAAMGDDEPLSLPDCKCLVRQLCAAVSFLHGQRVLHRDIKPSNILYHGAGQHLGRLVVCDFGLARRFEDAPGRQKDKGSARVYTPEVVTLYYRAPEILLGETCYSTEVDAWSVGCVFAEMLLGRVLLPGRGEIDQLDKIFRTLGGPPNRETQQALAACPQGASISWDTVGLHKSQLRKMLPEKMERLATGGNRVYLPSAGMELLEGLLNFDGKIRREVMAGALTHRFFGSELPRATEMGSMPRVEF